MRLSQRRKFFGKVLETGIFNHSGHLGHGRGYTFDCFTVDPANRVLVRSGRVVPLTARVFDVLLVLVENPGRLLGKDDLIKSVWHDEFVEEGNLARNVSTLRKALGDNSKEHKYIVTVQGRGYRFVADVSECDTGRENVNGNGTHFNVVGDDLAANTRSPGSGRYWLLSIGSFVLLGLAVAGLQMGSSLMKAKDGPAFDNIRQVKLTQSGNVIAPVISGDGRYLAYFAVQGSEKGLCLRQLATGSVLRLVPWKPETAIWGIDIAPDNSFVYYVLKDANTDFGSLYRVPLLGGTPHKVVERVAGLAVSPDGGQIAFLRLDRQSGTESIVIVNNDGSDERTVTSVQLDSLFYSLDWSPDGQALLYSMKQHEQEGDRWHIAEVPVSGGPETRIGEPSPRLISSTKWLPDKSGLISNMVDDTTRQLQLYFVSYPDGARRLITNDPDGSSGAELTADGKTIVTRRSNLHRQIWTMTKEGANNLGQKITGGTGKHVESVGWIGNDYLVFDEDGNGSNNNFNIWRMRPDGGDREQLTFGTDNNMQPAVSPNGETIAFLSRKGGKRQLWRMDINGKQPVQLTSIPHSVYDPRFSGDGSTIFFIASVGGKNQVWQVPAGGGEATALSDADVYNVWDVSPDGSKLAHIFFDEEMAKMRTRIQRLDSEAPDKIMDFNPENWMRWSSDGQSIYFNTVSDDARNVWRQDMYGSPAKQITNFSDEQLFRCEWSPDSSQMACIRQSITFDAVMIRPGS